MQLEVYEAAFHRDEHPPGEAPAAAQKAELPKLDTSIALWLILFVFGGGLLALYYAEIGYFPEVSWQDALTYMALMTIIGGSLLVAYSFLLFIPGAIWSELLIFDKQLHQVLMMGARDWEPCVLSVTKRILFPFAVFMASCHFLLYLNESRTPGLVAVGAAASLAAVSGLLGRDLREGLDLVAGRKADGQFQPAGAVPDRSTLTWYRWLVGAFHVPLLVAFIAKASDGQPRVAFLWTAALLPLMSFSGLLIKSRRSRRRPCAGGSRETVPSQVRVPDKWSLLCRSILAFGSAALLSLAALWFFHRIYRGEASGAPPAVPLSLLLLCTVVVIVTNLAVSVLFHKHPRVALLASFFAALLLLGAGQLLPDSRAKLPAKIMEKFGFGGQSVTLVLTERGGRLLRQQGIPAEIEERAQPWDAAAGFDQAGDPGPREDPGPSREKVVENKPREEYSLARIANVTILSRLGAKYLLRIEGRTIALPKEEVVSWSDSPKAQGPKRLQGL